MLKQTRIPRSESALQHPANACRTLNLAILIVILGAARLPAQDNSSNWYERAAEWNGYQQFHFQVAGRSAYLVVPDTPAKGNPWVWRARFPNYHAEMDVALLGKGFHIGYVDVAGLYGSPQAIEIGDQFYHFLTTRQGLADRVVLEGVSRGGLFVYNWAAQNPELVAAIYADTPVCDFKSWPAGRGTGLGSAPAWKECLAAYQLEESEALQFKGNPMDHAEIIARAKTPLLHVVSANDQVVPPTENTDRLQSRLRQFGHDMEVIVVPQGTETSHGHHFDHPDPNRVVEFIVAQVTAEENRLPHLLQQSRRIVFVGDSITYAGGYIASFEAWLVTQDLPHLPQVINVGLPSETVSGLSEEGHAGGRFPRPDLAERLDRVLAKTDPDLVVACYGINCGIYQPLDEERFHHYRVGLADLKDRVEAAGAEIVFLTPPTYDDERSSIRSFSYNAVLAHYSNWLLEQRLQGWNVIDLHGPMTRELAWRRQADPEFTFQPDAVHPNADGHWFITQRLIRAFGDPDAATAATPEQMLAAAGLTADAVPLIEERMNVLRNAFLTATGHLRPGLPQGLPLPEAEQKAAAIGNQIRMLDRRR